MKSVRSTALAIGGLTAYCVILTVAFQQFTTVFPKDLDVYRAAGYAVIHGQPLYDGSFTSPLPFTYPPFAALISVPFAIVPWDAVVWLWVFVSIALVAWLLSVVPANRAVVARYRLPLFVAGILVAVASVPVSDHLGWGQVGLLLMAMCVADVANRRPKWLPAGVLIGLAGAIKLVPLALLGYYVLARQWRAVATGIVTFIGAATITWLVLPRVSKTFFVDVLPSLSDRVAVGNPKVHGNQSIRAALIRVLPDDVSGVLYPILAALAIVLACYGAHLAVSRNDSLSAVVILGLCATAITPVAWTHHYVWLVLGVGLCVARGSRLALAGAAITLLVTLTRLPRFGATSDMPILSPLLTDSILFAAVLVAVALAWPDRANPPTATPVLPHSIAAK